MQGIKCLGPAMDVTNDICDVMNELYEWQKKEGRNERIKDWRKCWYTIYEPGNERYRKMRKINWGKDWRKS